MDLPVFYASLAALVRTDAPPGAGIDGLIDHARRLRPGLDDPALRELPWGDDARGVAAWLERVFRDEPPPPSVTGLWFGLWTARFDDETTGTVLSLSGCGRPPAPRWFEGEMAWTPSECEAPSPVLRSFRPDPEDEDAVVEQVVVQGYAALAVCQALRALPPPHRRPLAVAFGFRAGDVLLLGQLDVDGWRGELRVG